MQITKIGRKMMGKLFAGARALAVLLAILGGVGVVVPMAAPLLMILGAVAILGDPEENNFRVLLATVVLSLGAASLSQIPAVGGYLAAIFGGVGTAFMGASMMVIGRGLLQRIKSDWAK